MDGSTGLLTADYRRRWKKSGASANRVIRNPPLLWLVKCFALSLHYYTFLLEICKVLFQCFLIDNSLTHRLLFVHYVCFDLLVCIIICFSIRLCKESRHTAAKRPQPNETHNVGNQEQDLAVARRKATSGPPVQKASPCGGLF